MFAGTALAYCADSDSGHGLGEFVLALPPLSFGYLVWAISNGWGVIYCVALIVLFFFVLAYESWRVIAFPTVALMQFSVVLELAWDHGDLWNVRVVSVYVTLLLVLCAFLVIRRGIPLPSRTSRRSKGEGRSSRRT